MNFSSRAPRLLLMPRVRCLVRAGWGFTLCATAEPLAPHPSPPPTQNVADVEGNLRLVDGTSANRGRLEVYHSSQWGTVCDDRFDRNDAIVACRQLGLDAPPTTYQYDAGDVHRRGQIWMDELECTGSESSLSSCTFGEGRESWAEDCGHYEDVGLICGGTDVYLSPPPSPSPPSPSPPSPSPPPPSPPPPSPSPPRWCVGPGVEIGPDGICRSVAHAPPPAPPPPPPSPPFHPTECVGPTVRSINGDCVPEISPPSTPPSTPPSPPPPPAAPPSSPPPPLPPTYSTRPGYCKRMNQGSTNGRGYGLSHFVLNNSPGLTLESCFAMCDLDPICEQAVFETEASRWGTQCWLGTNRMQRDDGRWLIPDRSRTCSNNCDPSTLRAGRSCACFDTCYSKAGWGN